MHFTWDGEVVKFLSEQLHNVTIHTEACEVSFSIAWIQLAKAH